MKILSDDADIRKAEIHLMMAFFAAFTISLAYVAYQQDHFEPLCGKNTLGIWDSDGGAIEDGYVQCCNPVFVDHVQKIVCNTLPKNMSRIMAGNLNE